MAEGIKSDSIRFLELIDEEIFRNFLRGYTNFNLSGVGVYFKTCNGTPHTIDDIGAINPTDEEYKKCYHPLCRVYRFKKYLNHDAQCANFDKKIVLEYYTKPKKGPMLYRCHRELWDMAYPLRADDGQLIAVLFSGQVVIQKRTTKVFWQQVLKPIYSYVSWEYANSDDTFTDQIKDIAEVIEKDCELTCEEKELLKQGLAEKKKNISPQKLIARFKDFLEFGKITAELLSQLNRLHRLSAQLREQNVREGFQKECIRGLSNQPPNIRYWQESLESCLNRITGRYQLRRAGFFHGRKAKKEGNRNIIFELVAMNAFPWWRSSHTFDWNRDSFPSSSKVYPPGQLPQPLVSVVSDNLAREKFFYVNFYTSGADNIYTSVVFQSDANISEDVKNILDDLLISICRRDENVRLNLQTIESHKAFEQHVVEVRHDLKTNIQLVIDNIQKYVRHLRQGNYPDTDMAEKLFQLVRESIKDHQEGIKRLSGEVRPRKVKALKHINVYSIIGQQVNLFKAVCEREQVGIEIESSKEMQKCFILFNASEFNRGLQALLDNAIKYSYKDNRVIYINCESIGKEFSFSIQNYGIGIPPDKLDAITRKSVRARVEDSKRGREGTGLGLYIAKTIFEDQLRGKIEITSCKAPGVFGETEDFHRYLTTVTVTIPVEIEE